MKGPVMLLAHPRKEVEVTAVGEALIGIAGDRLRTRIRKSLQNGKRKHLLDLRPLAELDSSTLATLIRILRYVRDADGSIGLIVDQESFLKILSLTALDRIFPIFRDERSALDTFEIPDTISA